MTPRRCGLITLTLAMALVALWVRPAPAQDVDANAALFAVPRRWSRVVRPYATIGGGVIHVTSSDIAGIFPIDSTRPVASIGAGAWVPITARIGARASARYLRTRSEPSSTWFETWQVTVGATVKF